MCIHERFFLFEGGVNSLLQTMLGETKNLFYNDHFNQQADFYFDENNYQLALVEYTDPINAIQHLISF